MSDHRAAPRQTTDSPSPIAARRLAAGMTQGQLAERIGVAPQHVGRWERNERKPKIDALIRIADALGCDVRDLIS